MERHLKLARIISFCWSMPNHTVLLKSDGHVVACGSNFDGECTIPDLPDGVTYSPDASLISRGIRVFQLSFGESGDGITITCTSLAGEALCEVMFQSSDLIIGVPGRIAQEIEVPKQGLKFMLPNGNLFSSFSQSAHVHELLGYREHPGKKRRIE